ncbi:MAG TPA: hypothetical protein VLK33_07460, partial [Terriglobales bacterium]|nr:hypothetical protein [Terriglobales bacterium]
QKLSAGIRADLVIIAGTTEADKLIAIIMEKHEGLNNSLRQLVSIDPALNDFIGIPSHADRVMMMGFALVSVAQMAQLREDHKAKLVEKVGRIVSSIERHLKALMENAGV